MEKLKTIKQAIDDIQLEDVVIFDMRETSPFFDYFVIGTAKNTRQLSASIREIKDALRRNDYPSPSVEGSEGGWTLLDGHDIIVNVFTKDEREYYNIEKMWLDVPKIELNRL